MSESCSRLFHLPLEAMSVATIKPVTMYIKPTKSFQTKSVDRKTGIKAPLAMPLPYSNLLVVCGSVFVCLFRSCKRLE